MIRQLFHGSPSIIEKPQFGYGKVYNDYGLGFYCTDSLEMAKEWGVAQNRNGYANSYELDCEGLKILDLNGPSFNILHWLAVLLENREFDDLLSAAQQCDASGKTRSAIRFEEQTGI